MRILLQQRPESCDSPRFVHLSLSSDLFGGWELLSESGQLGQRKVSLRREQYLDRKSAIAALEKARDLQLKKGFQLMPEPGIDTPP
ncbi:MAG: WGR domain-containing protein [Pseudomonadota bacterium]|nr:WGR domain-containing protein [Pseudomonadota bacterium]